MPTIAGMHVVMCVRNHKRPSPPFLCLSHTSPLALPAHLRVLVEAHHRAGPSSCALHVPPRLQPASAAAPAAPLADGTAGRREAGVPAGRGCERERSLTSSIALSLVVARAGEGGW
eukprot:358690-Chlamydomonas_euryale.AAC.4